ncbi:hypothetical protein [Chryseobacterium contaminans]|uniref:Uncharacterized protein n=2 Tax=Chryseobacterium contaminans TaxID=1423959 RepID=A0A1M6ZJ78_9FLAO|nr:hypothetical protein [Chryseobacterium contaminans]SHL30558.1 hypothetical protein SAMN05444407_103261 [Chryseobacterium contaminans]
MVQNGNVFKEAVMINIIEKKMMKNISLAVAFIVSTVSFAQVAIEKPMIDGTSTILDFNNVAGNTKGLILPSTSGVTTGALVNGTFIFDVTDKKVKVYENDVWKPLSDAGDLGTITLNNAPERGKGVIIGAPTSDADGVLILESLNKAMILPQITTPHLNVKSPYPGMICYDVTSRSLAVFDGSVWNYWK